MFLSRLTPRFDVALVDVRSGKPEFRLEAARALALAEGDSARADARHALRPLLDDPVARIRAAAIESLGHVGDDTDLPALVRRLREPSPDVRQLTVVAIARIASDEARLTLRGLVDSDLAEVRYQAIESLGTLGDRESVDRIAARVADDDAFVREAAIEALVELGADDERDRIASRLDDAEESVRTAAAVALAAFGDPRATDALVAALAGATVPATVFDAIATLRANEAVPALRGILRRRFAGASARFAAASALAALGDAEGVAVLRRRLRSFFVTPRLETLARIASYRILDLAGDVAAVARTPRGLPLDLIAHTLDRLDASPEARDALAHLDRNASTNR